MMRMLVVGLVAVGLLAGCKKSDEGGGAGNETFKVVVPLLSADVKQGEIQTLRVSVDRSAGFKQAVKLEVKAPKGLTVEPDSISVKPGDKADVQLAIAAAKNAPLGEQKILVKGTPDRGEAVEIEFKITVGAK